MRESTFIYSSKIKKFNRDNSTWVYKIPCDDSVLNVILVKQREHLF